MTNNNEKLEIMYRYSMPIHWILDKLEDGVYSKITKFDICNARHELDIIMEGWNFPPEASDN